MVAKISTGKSIRAMLHYNENKIVDGDASLILASGFAGNIEQMNLNQKLNRFNHLIQLKPNVKTNAVHISLNFHSSEKLGDDKLQQIGLNYMERIGFGDQPYLIYRHDDAAHTHMHIVTTNITAERKRIDLNNICIYKSEPARKAIEQEFDLIKARSNGVKNYPGIKKINVEKVKYGYLPTKRAISNVLTAVNRDYKFTSLTEYNAVLKIFNVTALRGKPDSTMFEKKGLMYSVIDADGKPIGVPIKASSFYIKPTFRNLEKSFEKHNEKRKPYREELKQRIDKIFTSYRAITRSRFISDAEKEGISVLFRENDRGQVFGITYVDHKSKCVFNGSDLGKTYSAKTILEKLAPQTRSINQSSIMKLRPAKRSNLLSEEDSATKHSNQGNLLETLMSSSKGQFYSSIPRRKKKKRKQQQLTL